ncbi:MAG: GNAT family N-acetyltransferase [Candidatus Bathyarchaeia archaeon]|jgi:GNAT superfamily N-acetyltransferase
MKTENGKITFRRATVNDIQTLIDMRVRFLNELYGHQENDETKILRKSFRQYFSEAIPSGSFIAWLAEREGKTVGTGGMVVWQMPGRYGGLETGRLGYVLNMYTIPEARRSGVCTRLLKELIKDSKTLGLRYLHLHASEHGVNIYRKAGFVEPKRKELALKLRETQTINGTGKHAYLLGRQSQNAC